MVEDRFIMDADLGWLGLRDEGARRWSFELTAPLSRFDGKFYGGTGIAVLTATMEAATGRPALWATVQFAGSADIGDRVDCVVDVLAAGHRTSQVRFTASVGPRTFLVGIGATGDPRGSALEHHFAVMPDRLVAPEDTEPWRPNVPFPVDLDRPSWLQLADIREARLAAGRDRQLMWARMRGMALTRATLGFLADMVPSAVVRAAGRAGAGTSLDNAMRFGPEPDTDWMLIDFDPYFLSRGYAHGAARLWSPDGRLLAVASQTAATMLFD